MTRISDNIRNLLTSGLLRIEARELKKTVWEAVRFKFFGLIPVTFAEKEVGQGKDYIFIFSQECWTCVLTWYEKTWVLRDESGNPSEYKITFSLDGVEYEGCFPIYFNRVGDAVEVKVSVDREISLPE